MPKTIWMSAAVAAALLLGCGRNESMPAYPYDLPRADEKDVADVDLVGAILGETIDARLPSDQAAFTIHLADIIAPAKGQTWHPEAVAALNALVKGKLGRVRFLQSLVGPDGRVTVVGQVYVEGKDVSWELVGSGHAWVWEEKSNDPELKKLQVWAQQHKKGLWALPESDREPPLKFMERQLRLRMQQREESIIRKKTSEAP